MVASRNTVHDFARRTLANLNSIERLACEDGDKYFEVTQLINSAIGLLIFPKEADYNSVPETKLCDLPTKVNLPKILHGKLPEENLRQLVRYLRNGFAHYNVEFVNDNNIIKGVYIRNVSGGGADWVAYTSIDDLKALLKFIAQKLIDATERAPNQETLADLEKSLGKELRIISREGIS